MLRLVIRAGCSNSVAQNYASAEFTSASGEKFRVTFSGGIAEYPENGTELEALYRSAGATPQAKAEGGY